MKLLFCAKCLDIRRFSAETFTPCECGNMEARWDDPDAGTVLIKAKCKQFPRIIGMSNSVLSFAAQPKRVTNPDWRDFQVKHAEQAEGYLFHKDSRNSWAVIIRVGESNDVKWAPSSLPYYNQEDIEGYHVLIEEDLNSRARCAMFKVEVFDHQWMSAMSEYLSSVAGAREAAVVFINLHKAQQPPPLV